MYGITKIGKNLFVDAENLKTVALPDSISAIESNAFDGCENLEKILFDGDRDSWEQITITDGNDTITDEKICYATPSLDVGENCIKVYSSDESSVLLVATYNNNKFAGYTAVRVTSSGTKTLEDLGIDTTGADEINVFMWKTLSAMLPMCDKVSMNP